MATIVNGFTFCKGEERGTYSVSLILTEMHAEDFNRILYYVICRACELIAEKKTSYAKEFSTKDFTRTWYRFNPLTVQFFNEITGTKEVNLIIDVEFPNFRSSRNLNSLLDDSYLTFFVKETEARLIIFNTLRWRIRNLIFSNANCKSLDLGYYYLATDNIIVRDCNVETVYLAYTQNVQHIYFINTITSLVSNILFYKDGDDFGVPTSLVYFFETSYLAENNQDRLRDIAIPKNITKGKNAPTPARVGFLLKYQQDVSQTFLSVDEQSCIFLIHPVCRVIKLLSDETQVSCDYKANILSNDPTRIIYGVVSLTCNIPTSYYKYEGSLTNTISHEIPEITLRDIYDIQSKYNQQDNIASFN